MTGVQTCALPIWPVRAVAIVPVADLLGGVGVEVDTEGRVGRVEQGREAGRRRRQVSGVQRPGVRGWATCLV